MDAGKRSLSILGRALRRLGRPPSSGKRKPPGVPVDPRRPSTLDGGAAVALEFDA